MLVGGSLLYDVLWMVFCSSAYSSGTLYDGGYENSVKFLVFVTSLLSFLAKLLLELSIWIQKLKYERGLDDENKAKLNLNSSTGNLA